MRRNIIAFTSLFAASVVLAQAASPFAMNGWQFHEYDVPKLEEAVRKAPEYGVNFVIFSHQLFRSVEGFLNSPERQRDVLRVGALAQAKGISYYLWIHELDDIPQRFRVERRVNLDDPELLPYLRERYERLLAKVPGTAGFVLTFHESNNKVFRNREVLSKLSVPDRIYLLSKLIYDVAKKRNKTLIIRNFFYEPLEMDYFAEALSRLPDDVIVMSKDTCHEFDPFYPPDPMHGNVGRKKQIIEIDLGVEKALSTQGHYTQVEHIRRYAQRARDKGLAGMVGRCRLLWDRPFEDTHEVNLYAFSRFMRNPDDRAETVLEDWARKRYPAEAAPYITSALKRTEFINHHGRYFLGFWLTKSLGSEWDDYGYYFGHLLLRSKHKWTRDPADKKLEELLYYPDRATFEKLVAEKDEVLRQVRASAADIERAARYLTPAQTEPLREGFRFLDDAAQLMREWTRAYFAQRMWMQKPAEEYEVIVKDALGKLEQLDASPSARYGLNAATGHRYNIDHFVLEMRWRMKNRSRALAEDKLILERVRQTLGVTKN